MNIYTLEVFLISGPITEEFAKKNPVILRTIEIRGDQTLEHLHRVIFKAFNREDQHVYEFQIGGKGPNDPKARRYGLSSLFEDKFKEGESEGDVAQATIDSLKLKKDEAFGYWFDFGDDWWHQIDVISIEDKSPQGTYPRIRNKVGKSPPQYADFDDEDE
jgi:Plasmid pRiA4b ORF-3-like protein